MADIYACRHACQVKYDHCKAKCLALYGESPQGYGCVSSCDLEKAHCRKHCY